MIQSAKKPSFSRSGQILFPPRTSCFLKYFKLIFCLLASYGYVSMLPPAKTLTKSQRTRRKLTSSRLTSKDQLVRSSPTVQVIDK